MTTSFIKKAFAVLKDFACGFGEVEQSRDGSLVVADKINTIWLKESIDQIKETDFTREPFVSIFKGGDLVLYRHEPESTTEPDDDSVLMPDIEIGRWISYSLTVGGAAGSLGAGLERNELPLNSQLGRRIVLNAESDFTLTDSEAQAQAIEFTGNLSEDVLVQFPNFSAARFIENQTIGDHSLRISGASGPAIAVPKQIPVIALFNNDGQPVFFNYVGNPETASGATENVQIGGDHTHEIKTSGTLGGAPDSLLSKKGVLDLTDTLNALRIRNSFQMGMVYTNPTGIAWSPELELYIAVNNHQQSFISSVVSSSNGLNWEAVTGLGTTINSGFWTDVLWFPPENMFLAVGNNAIMYSSDGENWTHNGSVPAGVWHRVMYVEDLELLVSVAISGPNRLMTSEDGINWTARGSVSTGLYGVAWSPSLELLVAVGVAVLATSSNGIDWSNQITPFSNLLARAIEWSDELGLFVVSAHLDGSSNSITRFFYSSDGDNWFEGEVYPEGRGITQNIAWSPEFSTFICSFTASQLYGAQVPVLYRSKDGITWYGEPVPANNGYGIVYNKKLKSFIVGYRNSGQSSLKIV